MELRHIRYFVAVAEEQNITRAAARLHVSQPPLSRQIRELENELGVKLLERTPRSVRMTAAGWAFLEECYRVLRATDEAVRVAQRAAVGAGGQLRLGYAPGPTQELLREVLRTVRLAAPEANVTLHDLSTAEMLNGLREGRLDAALIVDPGAEARRGFVFERLRADPIVVAVAPEHRWGRRRVMRLREVIAEPLAIFSRKDYPEYLESLTRAFGVDADQLRIAEECDSGASLFAAVEAGQRVALVSSLLAAAVGSRLKLIGLSPAAPPYVIGLAYPAGSANRLLGQLIEAARRIAKYNGRVSGVNGPLSRV